MSLDVLKREFEDVTEVFFDLYDKNEADHQEALQLLAWVHDNKTTRENPVNLDYLLNLPEATSWLDDVVFHYTLDQLKWTIPLEGHQVTAPINRIDVGRPNTVAQLQPIVSSMPAALNRREIEMIAEMFHQSPTSVTGKPFFAVDHPRAKNLPPFSNILAPEFDSLETPALQLLAELVNEVITHFSTIGALQAVYTDDDKVRGNLLVIVHNDKYQTLFRELKTATVLPGLNLPDGTIVGERQNAVQNSFRLWRDHKAPAGQDNYIEFVLLTDPTGPKPAVYVVDTDPEPIVLDENRVKSGFYGVGFQKIFAVKPFVPNTTIQARPVLAPPALAGGIPGGEFGAAPRLELSRGLRRRGRMWTVPEQVAADDQVARLVLQLQERIQALEARQEGEVILGEVDTTTEFGEPPDAAGLLERFPAMTRTELDELHDQLLGRRPHGNAKDESVRESVKAALEDLLNSKDD